MAAENGIRKSLDNWLELAKSEGVEHEGNLPFFLEGEGTKRSAVLLVHGFTASPWEMLLPARHLASRGHDCLAVRLPGHGTSPEDLSRRRWQEWLQTVREGIDMLARTGQRVDAAGSSTGSLLLLYAAGDSTLRRLVLFSPYLRLRHNLAPFAGLLKHVKTYHTHRKNVAPSPYFYPSRPLAGIEQLNLLRAAIRPRLPQIKQPCLVLSSKGDRTVDAASAEELFSLLGSPDKEFHAYDDSVPHVLTTTENPQLHDALERLGRFLEK